MNLVKLVFEEGVKSISFLYIGESPDYRPFKDTALETVELPYSLVSFDSRAFEGSLGPGSTVLIRQRVDGVNVDNELEDFSDGYLPAGTAINYEVTVTEEAGWLIEAAHDIPSQIIERLTTLDQSGDHDVSLVKLVVEEGVRSLGHIPGQLFKDTELETLELPYSLDLKTLDLTVFRDSLGPGSTVLIRRRVDGVNVENELEDFTTMELPAGTAIN